MLDQLKISTNQLLTNSTTTKTRDNISLPKTMAQAMAQEQRHAIVVTKATPPFQIVHVNAAWEGLCGWSQQECQGKTLNLLQGRDTDVSSVTALMSKLLQGEEGGVIVTNYTKEGRRFRNHLRVGPMMEQGEELFVGILQEIQDGA
jgi:PAS domain S-box-containing protein